MELVPTFLVGVQGRPKAKPSILEGLLKIRGTLLVWGVPFERLQASQMFAYKKWEPSMERAWGSRGAENLSGSIGPWVRRFLRKGEQGKSSSCHVLLGVSFPIAFYPA